jgi:hypothetical protein
VASEIGTEEINFETCGYQYCVQPIFNCFDQCTPSCQNSTVEAYYDCMVRPTCYELCSVEYSDSIISGGSNFSVDINVTLTNKDCSITGFFADPIDFFFQSTRNAVLSRIRLWNLLATQQNAVINVMKSKKRWKANGKYEARETYMLGRCVHPLSLTF